MYAVRAGSLATRASIGVATAVRWLRPLSEGRRQARPAGGDRGSRLPAHEDWLLALVEAEPDLIFIEIAERLLVEHGVKADAGILSRFYTLYGSSFKKSVHASEQLRPDIAAARTVWRAMQTMIASRRLIFLDETGVTTNMVRRYYRARKGWRAKDFAPGGHWATGRITIFLAGSTARASPFRSSSINR